ncbi:class I adenylate-forming enzyme family protein [Actinophytocola sp.]|uniref:class I adenylate-forming enzyme family protein n=1 Tax=Actinophytocola sp. TaxID=1872138 RepID=UPI003D6A2119
MRADYLHRPALSVEGVDPLTYGDVHERRNVYANALLAAGVAPGDRVGLMLRNCVDYWPLHLAIATIGAITVRINFRLSADELDYVLDDSGCSLIVVHGELLSTLRLCRHRHGLRDVVVVVDRDPHEIPDWAIAAHEWLSGQPADPIPTTDRTGEPHMIMYTSGTTGRPKGAVWTHRSTVMFGAMQVMQWGATPARVAMTVGPLYHVGSMEDVLLPTLMSGGHAVITRSGEFSLRHALEVAAALRVTDLLLFPAMVYELLEMDDLDQLDLSSLRTLLTGGSPLVDRAVTQFDAAFPTVELWSVYGLTEGGGISVAMSPPEAREHPSAAGRPLPLGAVRIETDADAGPGVGGEICVRGPNTAVSYWNRPAESAETFVDGWVHTGDLGRIDANGILTVTGRKKDMIRTGDENVYAAEVERVLAAHPAVLESAVVGLPDARYGEAVCAVIVVRHGAVLSPSDVVAHCRAHLAGYKKPRYVAFVADLPRNATAKVVKHRLQAMLTEGAVTPLPTQSPERSSDPKGMR